MATEAVRKDVCATKIFLIFICPGIDFWNFSFPILHCIEHFQVIRTMTKNWAKVSNWHLLPQLFVAHFGIALLLLICSFFFFLGLKRKEAKAKWKSLSGLRESWISQSNVSILFITRGGQTTETYLYLTARYSLMHSGYNFCTIYS